MDDTTTDPSAAELRFQVGAIVVRPEASAALGADGFDLVLELVADHLRHAEPYEHGWISGVSYRGYEIAVATIVRLMETHVFTAAEARAVGDEVRALLRTGLLH